MNEKICPVCGEENPEKARFCSQCGAMLLNNEISYPFEVDGNSAEGAEKNTSEETGDKENSARVAVGTSYKSNYKRSKFDKSWIIDFVVEAVSVLLIALLVLLVVKFVKDTKWGNLFGQKSPEKPSISEPFDSNDSDEICEYMIDCFLNGDLEGACKRSKGLSDDFWYYYGAEEGFDNYSGYENYILSDYEEMGLSAAEDLNYYLIDSMDMDVELINGLGLSERGITVNAAKTYVYQCAYTVAGSSVGYDIYIYCYQIGGIWYALW